MFIAALFAIARTWKQSKYPLTDEWIKMLWYISGEVDEPRTYYIEWRKSEKQISYTNAYIWNLERWYWWTYSQDSRTDADLKNSLRDKSRGENGESSMEAYTLS